MASDYTTVIIGTGFGGTMTGLSLAQVYADRKKNETILMLERGTWWTTPVGTVQDKEGKTFDFLRGKGQPVQYWSSAENFRGFIDLVLRCVRRPGNEDGLYDLTTFGRTGKLGLTGLLGSGENDGVSILHASGVGGGSLVYANVTIRPPNPVFDDPRWPLTWTAAQRDAYYDLARDAIGFSVRYARAKAKTVQSGGDPNDPALNPLKINTGLSNISGRTARLNPHWQELADPLNPRGVRRIDQTRPQTGTDPNNALWIDRARVFQVAMSKLTDSYGTVDSAINDLPTEPNAFDPGSAPKNYCERQGRCIVGCLPGARHTLNKQLMAAIFGTPQNPTPQYPSLKIQALAEVEYVAARPEGGYAVHYLQRDADNPSRTTSRVVTADKVIVAAGCVGTNEILLRSKAHGGLPNLSEKLGFGFSTNGDYLAFLNNTRERVSLTRGPITTSFGHFNATADGSGGGDPALFHTIEDNGIPRALSSLAGFGVPMLGSLARGIVGHFKLFVGLALAHWAVKRLPWIVQGLFTDARQRHDYFKSEDEWTDRMMCIAGIGRDEAVGQFRMGTGPGETTLRVKRADGKRFRDDKIYRAIDQTLDRFARQLSDDPRAKFVNPFLKLGALGASPIALSHPLGGCRLAADASQGVADEYGRVFDQSKAGDRPFYEGLYVADAAMIPTALGVNPSLTISALALRIADKIADELAS
jgi:choline dehydrogenase-like flavoprotein